MIATIATDKSGFSEDLLVKDKLGFTIQPWVQTNKYNKLNIQQSEKEALREVYRENLKIRNAENIILDQIEIKKSGLYFFTLQISTVFNPWKKGIDKIKLMKNEDGLIYSSLPILNQEWGMTISTSALVKNGETIRIILEGTEDYQYSLFKVKIRITKV